MIIPAILVGVFLGAPLFSREFEQGTHAFAWTQSVSRWRWFMVKLLMLLVLVLLEFSALSAAITWAIEPVLQNTPNGGTPLQSTTFDGIGPILPITAALALLLGVFSGILTRRTVGAMFLMLVLFLVIRIPVEFFWRPHYEAPTLNKQQILTKQE